ncbi:MAG: T9SS type A sorting domain-containing protein, partial [Sphingobacteriaceae bacterium]
DLSFLSNNTWNVNISNPSMLFTTPTSFTTTNGWQQAVINFTTGAVTNSEQYIVIGNLQNKPGISKTPSPVNTGTCVYGSVTNGAYYYIDNVTLTTNSVTAIFNLPTGICTTQSVALNSLVSPSGGTFSGPYVTNNAGNWSFNAASTATIGSFSIAYNYTVNGCAYTIFKQIQVGSTHTVTATSNTNIICSNLSQNTATLTANSTTTGVNWLWQPNASTVNPVVVSPTATTIYTVTGNNQGCQRSATVAVKVQTACCTTSLTPYSGPTALSGNTLNTSMAFNYDIDVVSPSVVFIQSSEFQFAPGVKITVKPSGILYINGAHLYGCGTDLWQGIVVEDGGQLKVFTNPTLTPKDNFIEDAQIAIDIQTQATTGYTAYGGLLGVTNTIFNKNFIGISIDNYVRNVSPYPFEIHNNVFTSRTLTFTPTSWPTCSVTAGSLRAATNPTAGLIAPYPLAGSLAYLKNPYNSQPGHIGIRLTSVGSSTGTVQYAIQIGRTANVNDYNIFDNLGQCIEATNSNVFSVNNVFQNTQQYTFDPPGPNPPYTFEGNGIRHVTNNSSFNSKLDLWSTSTNMSLGNRFYDCQYSVNCDKTFLLNVRYCTFRSTKTTSAAATGSVGVISRTNRFNHTISNNNIANIHTPINIALAPDTYTYNGNSGYGINAQNLAIQSNFIGAQTTTATAISNQFVNQAITLSAPTGSVYQVTLNSFAVTTNTIDRVFRGIEINNFGKNNFTANTSTNTIKLGDDNVFALPQYGIRYSDNYKGTIRSNTLSATGITNTLITLFYAGNSVANPTVICNSLSNAYVGFEFNSNNSNLFWRGNFMNNHTRGMQLINNGIIGNQGNSTNPSDNVWTGTWTGNNNGTFVDGSSNAVNSKLSVKTLTTYAPPNPGWFNFGQSYGIATNTPNANGAFTGCGTGGGGGGGGGASATAMLSSTSIQSNTLTNEVKYIQDFGNYQTSLTSTTSSNVNNQSLTNINGANSISQFLKVDGMYYSGNFVNAKALNASITCTNSVESVYKTYYSLYDKFITNSYTDNDNNALSYIAELCPSTNGTAVYKARALFNYINQTARVYNDNCLTVFNSARENNNPMIEISPIIKLEVDLFPNPAQNFVTLYSNQLNQKLDIVITDVGGKIIEKSSMIIIEHTGTIELKLQNGVYFVTITNFKNDKIIKKLIINK